MQRALPGAALAAPRLQRRRRAHAAARACAAGDDAAPPPLRVSLRTSEARASLRFTELRSGRATVVAISAVADASEAWACGVRPGDRLTAISDPVRPSVLWELADSASLRFVRDALRLRVAPSIELQLAPGAAVDALRAAQAGLAMPAVPVSSTPGLTVAEALEEAYAARDRGALPTASERRTKRREAYLEEVGKRDDTRFFATFAAVVLSTPLVILAVAAANGWLMTPYSLH